MSNKKPIVDKGIIIYYDYDFIFNFLTDEEVGKTIRLLLETKDNPTLNPTLNPTNNSNINNAYNYIASRILEYKKSKGLAIEWGKTGGNPTLMGEDNPTVKEGDKGGDKLIEENRIENKIIEENNIQTFFTKFYSEYPLHKSKAKSEIKFSSLLNNSEEPEKLFNEIMDGLAKYKQDIEEKGTEKKFIKHPITWLNGECWNDEYTTDINQNLPRY